MIVIYNRTGIAIVAIGCILALVASRLVPTDLAGVPFLALGVAWCVADVFYRFKWGGRRLVHRLHGGHLYYVPMWVWGLVFLGMGVQMMTASIRLRQPLPPAVVRPRAPATTTTTTTMSGS